MLILHGKERKQNLGSHHARGAEAAGHAARAHTFQVIVLAGLGAFEPFGPRVVSRAHQFDHGGSAGQAPLALESGKPQISGGENRSAVYSALHPLRALTPPQRLRLSAPWDTELPDLQPGPGQQPHLLI